MTTRQKLKGVFRWFGLGSFILGLTLFGSVQADAIGQPQEWRLVFLVLGGIGSLCILIGLGILLINIPHLWRGEDL